MLIERYGPRVGALALTLAVSGPAWCMDVPSPEAVKAAIGHLGPVPVPEDNPLSAAKVALGEKLFNDNRLAGDGSLSCRTCHLPEHGFAVQARLGPAYPKQQERRNSPTLVNVAYNLPLIWDGRAGSLDKQALGPLKNIIHMNNDADLLIEQLKTDDDYPSMFEAAFGEEGMTPENLGRAIASYERTLVFDDSPLDRYMDGDEEALTEAQRSGL
ncbi:MAG: cytochrome-c peroxidase, partial [Chromatiales bacterium]